MPGEGDRRSGKRGGRRVDARDDAVAVRDPHGRGARVDRDRMGRHGDGRTDCSTRLRIEALHDSTFVVGDPHDASVDRQPRKHVQKSADDLQRIGRAPYKRTSDV